MEWRKGPLGFPASVGWEYWIPTKSDGKFRAIYSRGGRFDVKPAILGDNLATLEEAQRICEEHNASLSR